MKKIISILTITILLLAIILPTFAQAASFTITGEDNHSVVFSADLSKTTFAPGETVILTLALSDVNPTSDPVCSVQGNLYIDETIFKPITDGFESEEDVVETEGSYYVSSLTGAINYSDTTNKKNNFLFASTNGITRSKTIVKVYLKVRENITSAVIAAAKPIKLTNMVDADNAPETSGISICTLENNVVETLSSAISVPYTVSNSPVEGEETITINPTSSNVVVGGTVQLTANSNKTTNFTWSSSDSTVATVDQTGKVTGMKAGTATITVRGETATATCIITVTSNTIPVDPSVETISINKTIATVDVNGTVQLRAESSKGATITWSSSDSTVATVDQTGKVTGVKAGSATITARGETATATCYVNVQDTPSEEERQEATDFSNAKVSVKQSQDVRKYTFEISGVTPKENHVYTYSFYKADGTPFTLDDTSTSVIGILKYDESKKVLYTSDSISNYLELGEDAYIMVFDKYIGKDGSNVYLTVLPKTKLEKPEQKKYTDAFYATIISRLDESVNAETQILFNTPWDVNTKRKVTIKIGKISDDTILKKLYNKNADALPSLLTYAKSADGFYNKTMDSNDGGKAAGGIILSSNEDLFDASNLKNGDYYFLYAVVEDENGKYVKTEGVTFAKANVVKNLNKSYSLNFFGSEDFEWSEEIKKAAESETDPAKGAKDSTTSTTKIPQTGTNEVIITLVVAGLAISGVVAFIGYRKNRI